MSLGKRESACLRLGLTSRLLYKQQPHINRYMDRFAELEVINGCYQFGPWIVGVREIP